MSSSQGGAGEVVLQEGNVERKGERVEEGEQRCTKTMVRGEE